MWRDTAAGGGQGPPHRGAVPGGPVPGGARSGSWRWSCSPSPSDPTGPDGQGAPGLFWVAVLFCTVLAIQRSVSVESVDGARDGLRLSGLDPAGVFLGKSAAVAAQLVVLEAVLGVGVVAPLRRPHRGALADRGAACVLGTVGLAAAEPSTVPCRPACG